MLPSKKKKKMKILKNLKEEKFPPKLLLLKAFGISKLKSCQTFWQPAPDPTRFIWKPHHPIKEQNMPPLRKEGKKKKEIWRKRNFRSVSRLNHRRSNVTESMEGVGARLGRSSTRYGPTTVFTGPVRKWKKKWVPVSPSNNSSSSSSNQSQNGMNGSTNGNNGSHLVLFKWTPISQNQNNNNGDSRDTTPVKEDGVVAAEEPPRRKFKYIPVICSQFPFLGSGFFSFFNIFFELPIQVFVFMVNSVSW